jgi:acetyl-CoA synthetase
MFELSAFPIAEAVSKAARLSHADYQRLYRQSIDDPDTFWGDQARALLHWFKAWQQVQRCDFAHGQAAWFEGGELNVSYNCIDRHLDSKGEQVAIIWEGDHPSESAEVTYRKLHRHVCRLANVLKSRGVRKGDRVCIYMPMIPEAAYAMLACARIGAVHSVVFSGFSAEALADRLMDAGAQTVITADESVRAGVYVGLKDNVDHALLSCPQVSTVIVVQRTEGEVQWFEGRDLWYHVAVHGASVDCPAEPMAAEDPLFILYTSGSTGKPKGVLHSTAGYLLQTLLTYRDVFDYREGDIHWCTADIGWITGQSYIVYGPLAAGATTLMFEGVAHHPDASRSWRIIDKHQVSTFYAAPSSLRALMKEGNEHLLDSSRESLRVLGSVGEPINPEAWNWFFHQVGRQRCPIVDTWWQTETGAIMLSPLVGTPGSKPGSAMQPMFGVQPVLLSEQGELIEGAGSGLLALKSSWPAQIRSVWGDHQRMIDSYFAPFPGYYLTGDGARRDADGDLWITGRVDDVINVSGHRIGTAEIESALVLHDSIVEAAVVGYPHPLKGQGIYAFVTPMTGVGFDDALREELLALVSHEIGRFARPELLQATEALPKTRSGKIMRRLLRRIASNQLDDLGDTSTLTDASVVDGLIANRLNR